MRELKTWRTTHTRFFKDMMLSISMWNRNMDVGQVRRRKEGIYRVWNTDLAVERQPKSQKGRLCAVQFPLFIKLSKGLYNNTKDVGESETKILNSKPLNFYGETANGRHTRKNENGHFKRLWA